MKKKLPPRKEVYYGKIAPFQPCPCGGTTDLDTYTMRIFCHSCSHQWTLSGEPLGIQQKRTHLIIRRLMWRRTKG